MLFSLATTVAKSGAKVSPPPGTVPCKKHGPARATYTSNVGKHRLGRRGHAIPLAVKRATVTVLDGALPGGCASALDQDRLRPKQTRC